MWSSLSFSQRYNFYNKFPDTIPFVVANDQIAGKIILPDSFVRIRQMDTFVSD